MNTGAIIMPEGPERFKLKAKKALENIARLAATFSARQEMLDKANKQKAESERKTKK
jgi:hypothetical protein